MTHMTKRAALRRLLRSERVSRVVGAHDALSAKLAERHGFDAIWASSFGISASAAVPRSPAARERSDNHNPEERLR